MSGSGLVVKTHAFGDARLATPAVAALLAGGGDWQTVWPDGRMDIAAHYVLEIDGQGTVEVRSDGVRHGPPAVLAALARGEIVPW